MMNFVLKTRSCVSKSHKNEELCIKNEEFCIQNDEICRRGTLHRASFSRTALCFYSIRRALWETAPRLSSAS